MTAKKKSKAGGPASEPVTRVIRYQETVFLCGTGGHETRRVYLWRGAWYCLADLKKAIRAAGGTAPEAYAAAGWRALTTAMRDEFHAEDTRRAERMVRVDGNGDR
ncbi:MAG: hypothetical protein ABSG40_16115 [Terriglobales bacterium]|jgi:hypothetical protein